MTNRIKKKQKWENEWEKKEEILKIIIKKGRGKEEDKKKKVSQFQTHNCLA